PPARGRVAVGDHGFRNPIRTAVFFHRRAAAVFAPEWASRPEIRPAADLMIPERAVKPVEHRRVGGECEPEPRSTWSLEDHIGAARPFADPDGRSQFLGRSHGPR